MYDECKSIWKSVQANHHNVYVLTEKLRSMAMEAAQKSELGELADISYALNEVYKMLDDSRKSVNVLKGNLDTLVCALWAKQTELQPDSANRIETQHCFVHPRVDMIVQVPHRPTKPEKFEAFMRAFGVPEELYKFRERDAEGNILHDPDGNEIIDTITPEVVRLHYPGVCEYVKRELSSGKPLPPEIEENSQKLPSYSLRIVSRKAVNE